jgi:hypothetical protein
MKEDPNFPCGIRYGKARNIEQNSNFNPFFKNGRMLVQSKPLDNQMDIRKRRTERLIEKEKNELVKLIRRLDGMVDSFTPDMKMKFKNLIKDSRLILKSNTKIARNNVNESDVSMSRTTRNSTISERDIQDPNELMKKSKDLIRNINRNLKIKTRV